MSDLPPVVDASADAPPADTGTPIEAPPVPDAGADAGGIAPDAPAAADVAGGEPAVAPTWLAQQPPEVQKYITELRQESAGYRDRFKPYRDAFDGYEDTDRDIWLEAARTFRDDPVAVAEWMRDQAESILAGAPGPDTDPTDGGAGEDDPDRPLTKADLDRYFADRDRAAQEKQAEADRAAENAKITSEAAELGYQPNTPQYAALIFAAVNQTNGDLKAAHEALEADKKAAVKAALDARAADANGSPRTPPPTGGATPTGDKELTFEAAREASRARRSASPIGR